MKGVFILKKDKDILPDEPILKENPQRVYDKDTELYDTVLDDVVSDDDSEDNVEAEYEGVSEDVLNDNPPL